MKLKYIDANCFEWANVCARLISFSLIFFKQNTFFAVYLLSEQVWMKTKKKTKKKNKKDFTYTISNIYSFWSPLPFCIPCVCRVCLCRCLIVASCLNCSSRRNFYSCVDRCSQSICLWHFFETLACLVSR